MISISAVSATTNIISRLKEELIDDASLLDLPGMVKISSILRLGSAYYVCECI